MRKLNLLLYLTLIAFILHTIEEYITKLYNVDPFIVWFSNHSGINGATVYLLWQALGFLLIFSLLILTYKNKLNKPLAITLGLVFILELLHPYNSMRVWGYYSGLYSGVALVVIGCFYWKELISQLKKRA